MSYESFLKNIDAIITPVLLIGLDGTIKLINRAFVEAAHLHEPSSYFAGRPADTLLGKELVVSCVGLAQKDVSQKGTIKNFSFAKRNANSEKINWDVTVTQWLVDDMSDGVLLSFKEVGRDYSQSKEHRFMDAIISGTRDAMVIMTGDYRMKKVNQTFLDLMGGKVEDYIKKNLCEFVFDFDRFLEDLKSSSHLIPFHCVLRRYDNEPVNYEAVARSMPASMFASSEQSGVSEVYWVLELRVLSEKDSRIVETLSGKILAQQEQLANLKEYTTHLNQQLSELSTKKDLDNDKDWADNLMTIAEERDELLKAKQDASLRLMLLQKKYNEDISALKKDQENILIDHQSILQEKKALANVLTELRDELAKLQQEHTDANDAMVRLQEAFLNLEDEKLVLQEQHRLALEAQKIELEQQHKIDLNTVASTQQMLVTAERQKYEEAFVALNQECAEKLADNEAVHQSMCKAYETLERELADARRCLAEREQADVLGSTFGQLLSGATERLSQINDIFAEVLGDLPSDWQVSPAVKNLLAANRDLGRLVDSLNLFSDDFKKSSPQPKELLDCFQTWQKDFCRQNPSLDLYFKYPVDGKAVFYDLQVRAILRELVENAAEALADQAGAEVKVKIQIKSPEEMAQCHFKKEIGQNCLLVQVFDNGETMFDPEQVVKHYYSNKDGHLGLGLSIVRFLLESMGGELELRSTPNGGVATFYVPLT